MQRLEGEAVTLRSVFYVKGVCGKDWRQLSLSEGIKKTSEKQEVCSEQTIARPCRTKLIVVRSRNLFLEICKYYQEG